MKSHFRKFNRNQLQIPILITVGILINVLLSYCMNRIDMPLFLDTVGTVAVASIGGLFPGILTAVVTNIICTSFNPNALYFTLINALVAVYTATFIKNLETKKVFRIIEMVLILAAGAGVMSSVIQWWLLGEAQHSLVAESARWLAANSDIPLLAAIIAVSIPVNILDKGLSVALSVLILRFLPESFKNNISRNLWRQRPLTNEERKKIKEWSRDVSFSLSTRMTLTLIGVSVVLVFLMGWFGARLFFEANKEEKTQNAKNAVEFAASIMNADKVEDYLKKGKDTPGYKETEELFLKIRDTTPGVEYLYALKVEPTGSTFIIDLPSESEPVSYELGEFVPIEPAFEPYLPALLAGEEIEPVEAEGPWGWIRSVYYPVRNSSGRCVCYVGADVSLTYITDYIEQFVLKIILIVSGFFIMIIAYGIWSTKMYTASPISSIALCADNFASAGDSQAKMDQSVRDIRSLNIRTGDEVEKLYLTLCRMTLNQTEQMRNIRYLSDSTAKMQDGLIITMADMVENRDSDTGAHVQKTSAYVKIIVEGLKKKGYYPEKITPKFISDVIRSAPLHDVGKINIPDGILNKPGKLTDEEFEIMKSHTTAGKKIMENAISTIQGENYLKEARNMAAYHHERWDGKGYPEALHGEVIPLSARIMAVADVFDALTSPRVYKPAFPLEKALAILREGSGTQFDPKCVEVFLESLPEVKTVLRKYNQDI